METAVWLFCGSALLLVLVAATLWRGAQVASRRQLEQQFVEMQVGQRTRQGPDLGHEPDLKASLASKRWRGPQPWRYFLLQAGVEPGRAFYVGHGVVFVLALTFGISQGPIATLALVCFVVAAAFFRLWLKLERRRRAMVRQIPEFLDRVVRMMTVGQSMSAAFHTAATTSVAPLNEVMGTTVSLHRSGQDLHLCMRQVSRQYGLRELYLIAAVIGVATQFGGRSDHVLERMAAFMRDLEQARAEMVAMSGELRLSAWILGLLPIGLACFILMFNNDLFMGMWHDPVGSRLLMGAVGLQAAGSYFLYRLAKSV